MQLFLLGQPSNRFLNIGFLFLVLAMSFAYLIVRPPSERLPLRTGFRINILDGSLLQRIHT